MRKGLVTVGFLFAAVNLMAWQATTGGSLADAAEKARREREAKKAQKVTRSYTEADLRGGSPDAASTGSETGTESKPDAAASAAPGAKKEKTDDELRADKKKDIEARIAEHQRMMGVIRKAMDEAQNELNDQSTSTLFGSRGAALQKRLEDGKLELAKAEQAIADIQEEARRQGIAVSR